MDLNKYNLRQLLEIALRFPEIGAVNFNIVYLILKTIIKKQGIECLTPKFTFVYESPSDSTKEKIIIEKESRDESDEKEQEKEKKMVEMEEEIRKLNETVEQMTNRISELETRPIRKAVKKKKRESVSDEGLEFSSEDDKETISETVEQTVREVVMELITNVSDDKMQDSLTESGEKKKLSKTEKVLKLPKRKFSWHPDRAFNEKLLAIKKEVESLKETDQKEIWAEMQTLQDSNDFVVKKFEEFLQDFETVMNGYSKLGMEVEELGKVVNKKITIEDDVEKLKEQLDKLDTYVYSGKHEPVEKEERKLDDAEHLPEEEEGQQFGRGEVEKPPKVDRKTHFARMVKNLMAMPEEKRAEIRRGPVQKEVSKVKPTTMTKAYEKFIQAARKTHVAKEEGAEFEQKDTEQAETIDTAQPQEQAEIPTSEIIIEEEEAMTPIKKAVQKKFHKAAKAVTLLQDMYKTQQEARLVKAKEMEAYREFRHREDEENEQQELSAESFEIFAPLSQKISIEQPKPGPVKATLLFGDDKASQELKERIVMYIKSRLEEMETQFMDKMHTLQTSIIELQDENEVLREELLVLKSRLVVAETNQNKFEGRLTAVEEKANLNDLHIEKMMIAIDKKADRFDVTQGMSKKDMSMLEDRMLKINETTLLDIEELQSFLKDYTVKLRDELDEKVSGFDMDCRLEPLAGRLKRLEKMLKDVSLKARVLECQTMGPIEVKRYRHCEDGKRIKPLRRPVSNWTSAVESKMSIYDDRFFDGETAEKIEADVQKRLEDAVFRDSKHFIGGTYTKTKVARSN